MAKHYLDPKQTEGPQDVFCVSFGKGPTWSCYRVIGPSQAERIGEGPTEAAALAAARKAAGYETEE